MRKSMKLTIAGAMLMAVAAPAATFALDAGADRSVPVDVLTEVRLDEPTPSVRYKLAVSAAENAGIADWLEARGVDYTWTDADGSSGHVYVEEWGNEAQQAMSEYNTAFVTEGFPAADVSAVNAETDAMAAALNLAGIETSTPFDEEGFKELIVEIDDEVADAQARWELANEVIAGLGS
ncbi:hypothetical protein [Ilumatobacter nonamiensis]|uniref:hypothetical protein n=1 Tax=Ilumatobacter nonamiensis TaxID=467093 RepID=UPI000590EE3D|nr:hypothetical protein [Ilumatobacter nonamiensis]